MTEVEAVNLFYLFREHPAGRYDARGIWRMHYKHVVYLYCDDNVDFNETIKYVIDADWVSREDDTLRYTPKGKKLMEDLVSLMAI